MNLLSHGLFGGPAANAQQRPPNPWSTLRQWECMRHFDDSTSNEEGEVDDEDEMRPREDESGDQDEDAAVEAKGGADGGAAERGHHRAKVGKSGQSHFRIGGWFLLPKMRARSRNLRYLKH